MEHFSISCLYKHQGHTDIRLNYFWGSAANPCSFTITITKKFILQSFSPVSLEAGQAWCFNSVSTHGCNLLAIICLWLDPCCAHICLLNLFHAVNISKQFLFCTEINSTCWVAVWGDCNLKLCSQKTRNKRFAWEFMSLFSLVNPCLCYRPHKVATKVHITPRISCHFHANEFPSYVTECLNIYSHQQWQDSVK